MLALFFRMFVFEAPGFAKSNNHTFLAMVILLMVVINEALNT